MTSFDVNRRDKIIDLLNELHRKNYNRTPITILYKDDISLEKYVYKRGDKRERTFVGSLL